MQNSTNMRILELLQFLYERTDENHPATVSDIIAHLNEKGIQAVRQTVYADTNALIDAGIDIVVVKSTQNQYFMGSRLFEYPELKMLTDAVASSKIISARKSEELVQKLCRLTSTHQAEQLRQLASLSSRVKPDNEQVYYIIDAIQTAILEKRQIQFQYYEYTPEKKRVLKHGGYLYQLDPYALEWKNDHYYLIGFSHKHQRMAHFRVDRLSGIKILPSGFTPDEDFDVAGYTNKIVDMFAADRTVSVELLCENKLMKTIISGYKVSADDRDKLQLIKKYAEQGKFDILLVFMFDRLGRKSDETPFVVEWFTKKGVRVWSVQEGEQRFESHTDRLTNYIRFWQADGESQKTSMRTKTALGQMVEEGRFRGGNAPYGYRLEKSGILNKRKHEVYMLVIDEDEARVVRMMFDLCISSGYGRWRLANFLNDHGIKNRKGQNWHDASVGGILHNPLYKGILRSGETYAGPFEALQIIAPDQFDLAQKLMLERTNERKERRTVPLNTAGQSLLSGNIFCGHCGGRLVLTTNGTTTRLADGTPVHKKRIRYVCYNKTRRRQECTGQTGYTMHILDGIVTEVLHQVFDKMQGASNDMIVGSAVQKQMAMIRSELQRARAENTKANKEYESLKSEVLKAIQGKSALPQDVLTEMLEDTRQKVLSTSERITTLTAELNDGNSKIEEMKAEFNRIVSWSKIFDESPMEVKKMICGYIIKKVSVFRDYRVKIEFNINVEQFLNGIDSIDECATYELPMAQ